jgi:hypothetical protein
MFAMLATMIFSCAPRVVLPPSAMEVPEVLMPHCMAALDPHLPGVRAHEIGNLTGYRLDLWPLHPLRYAGLEDDDFVYSVNGYPLGTAHAWHLAYEGTRGQTRCVWEIVRQGEHLVRGAELVEWPAPEPLQAQPDGTITVSRTALALALTRLPRMREEHTMRPFYPYAQPELQEVMATAGLPPHHAVNAEGETFVRSTSQLFESLAHLLQKDEAVFVLQDLHTGKEQTLRVRAQGPAFPFPPKRASHDARRVLADAELMHVLEETLLAWSVREPGACRARPNYDLFSRLDGYRISAARPGSPCHEMGLRNDDVLEAIDGLELHDSAMLEAIAASLPEHGQVELRVRRTSDRLTLMLGIQEAR